MKPVLKFPRQSIVAMLLALVFLRSRGDTWQRSVATVPCMNQIHSVPLRPMKAAVASRNFVRFRYRLSSTDDLLIDAHEDTETSIGAYDVGFRITRDGKLLRRLSFGSLREVREMDAADAFVTLAVSRVCKDPDATFFVTVQYMGDETSPAFALVLSHAGSTYKITTTPLFSGGVIEVSPAHPDRLKIWDNLHEGGCKACETAYSITEYGLQEGKPKRLRTVRTKRMYSSINARFDDRRRIAFVP